MEDFRIIYRILKYLQQSMDFEEFDCAGFTAERFGTNPNRFQRSELDWLIYNDPIAYADLVLNGDPKRYLKSVTEYKQ